MNISKHCLLLVASTVVATALAQPAAVPARLFAPEGGTEARRAPGQEAFPAASMFADYDIVYAGRPGEPGTLAAVTSHGLRLGTMLVYNELASRDDGGRSTFMRGNSGVAFDWETARTRLILGDMSGSGAGSLSDRVRLGGIGIQRGDYRSSAPAASPFRAFAGETGAGGTVDVYVDGVHVRNTAIQPGASPLRNLARFTGLRPVEVVVRDGMGREVRTLRNAYRADRMLPAGSSEFEYMVGAAREDRAGDGYGDTAFVASHRVALSDRVTLGGHLDGVGRDLAGTLGLGARLDGFGLLSGELGFARDDASDAEPGVYGSIRYTHSYRGLNVTVGYLHADAAYRSDGETEWAGLPAVLVEDVGAKVSYSLPLLGTITLTSTRSTYAGSSPQTLTTMTYSYERSGRWRVDWTLAYGSRTPGESGREGLVAGLNLAVALDAPVKAAAVSPFGWRSRAQTDLIRAGFDEDRHSALQVQPGAAQAVESARRFETAAGTFYGTVETADVSSTAPTSWQIGWSGSLLGRNGTQVPLAVGQRL